VAAVCAVCEGTGFRIVEEGGFSRASECSCRREDRQAERLAAARLPAHFANRSLENFETRSSDLAAARRSVEEFCAAWPAVEAGLLLIGSPGVGKTHLAVALLRYLVLEKGASGLFCDFQRLLKTIQASWDPASQASESAVLAPVTGAEILVLDDLGSTRTSGWVQDTLFHILNARYIDHRTTIVTTNRSDGGGGLLDPKDTLEGMIGTVQRSRLAEMCRVVQISDAADFRRAVLTRSGLHPY